MRALTYILWALAGPSMFGLLLIATGLLDWGVRAVAMFSLIGIAAVTAMAFLMISGFKAALLDAAKAAGYDPEASEP